MNSTPDPKETERAGDAPIRAPDERLAHAHEQIKRADEQLTRLDRAACENRSAMTRIHLRRGPDPKQPDLTKWRKRSGAFRPRRRDLPPAYLCPPAGKAGAPHARRLCRWRRASIVAALVLQLSYDGGPSRLLARWAPQLAPRHPLPPDNPPVSRDRPPPVCPRRKSARRRRVCNHRRKQQFWLRPHRKTPRRQRPQRFPITHSCCKRWRAISRISSEASNSSRRTSSKSPATIQRPLVSSRRARKR